MSNCILCGNEHDISEFIADFNDNFILIGQECNKRVDHAGNEIEIAEYYKELYAILKSYDKKTFDIVRDIIFNQGNYVGGLIHPSLNKPLKGLRMGQHFINVIPPLPFSSSKIFYSMNDKVIHQVIVQYINEILNVTMKA